MIVATGRCPPVQVQAVVLIVGGRLVYVMVAVGGSGNAAQRSAHVLVDVLVCALCWGLWRGVPVARWLAILWGAAAEVVAVAHPDRFAVPGRFAVGIPLLILGLLVLPRAARRWFSGRVSPPAADRGPLPAMDAGGDGTDAVFPGP